MSLYGSTPEPSPGDIVIVAHDRRAPDTGAEGRINGDKDYYPDGTVMVIFGNPRMHRTDRGVIEGSGGPCPAVPIGSLRHVATGPASFWEWRDGRRGKGLGVDFTEVVNIWEWTAE